MTVEQKTILRYIEKNVLPSSISTVTVGNDKVKVIDSTGESMTLTMNIFCDIIDADTKLICAISDLPHDIYKIGNQLPGDWTEVDQQTRSGNSNSRHC